MALPSSQSSVAAAAHLGENNTVDSLGLLDTSAEIARWEADRQQRGINSNLQFAPLPVTKTQKAENVAKLHLMTQKRKLAPIFDYNEVDTQSFNATLRIHDQVFTAHGPFSSKKEAKEAVARLGVEYLTGHPNLNGPPQTAGSGLSGGPADISELNKRAQKLKIAPPEYLLEEVSKGQFSVSLILGSTTFEERGPFQNKKLAKEAIAKLGLAHLQHVSTPAVAGISSVEHTAKLRSFIDRYRLDPPIFDFIELVGTPLQYRARLRLDGEIFQDDGPFLTKQEATSAITKQGVDHLEKKYIENEENWIDLLNLFSQASTYSPPIYVDFQEITTRQNLWSSELNIPLRPEPFGRRDLPFGSKKLARQNAAREAILWLREQGFLSEDGPPKKKQKKRNSSSASGSPPVLESPRGDDRSYAQQVNDLCIRHNIHVPNYELKPAPEGPFYSGFARFANSHVIANGRPIGHVENIFGQKKAKEAVARNVLRYLDEYVKEQAALDQELLRNAGFATGTGMTMNDVPVDAK